MNALRLLRCPGRIEDGGVLDEVFALADEDI